MARPSDSLRRWLNGALTAACGACVLLAPRTSAAFKESGHRAIERLAYQTLVDSQHSDVLERLVKAGALRGVLPRAPNGAPDPNAYIGLDEGDLNVHGVWIGSHMPDHEFNRQFQSYGQCFHFNARGEDARTDTDSQSGVPIGLSRDAYFRCMSLMDVMIRGILADTVDANARHVGLYSLIHMVTDSFSEAHVARERDWDILYVKPWRLRTWFTNLGHWDGWETFVTDTHHGIFDDRDYDYVADACVADKENVEKLTAACLSSRAKRASDAVADLLVLVSAYIDFPDAPKGGARELPGFEEAWREYRKKYFRHALELSEALKAACAQQDPNAKECADPFSALPPQEARDTRLENLVTRSTIQETEAPSVGVGLTFDLESRMDNLWLEGDVFYGRDSREAESVGLGDSLTHALLLRLPFETADGQRPLAAAYELGFRVPGDLLESEFASLQLGVRLLRLGYGVSRIGPNETRHIGEAGFGGFSADLVLKQRVWVGVIGPRVVYRLDTWGPDDRFPGAPDVFWSLKTGVAFGTP